MRSWFNTVPRLTGAACLLVGLLACPKQDDTDVPAPTSNPVAAMQTTQDPDVEGVVVELSDGSDAGDAYVRPPLADTTRLSDADTAALLARLPPLPDEAPDQSDFARRADSRPAPRPGIELAEAFPPPPTDLAAPTVDSGPLHLLRAAPQGDVPLAPQLSLTFDQPMVAVTGQDDAAAQVPVRLDPEPPGQWRWLGTRTLVFEPDGHFPMATEYTVTVPADTRSATGGSLDAAQQFVFRTPPPDLVVSWPNHGPQPRQPVIMLGFDQAIDADAVHQALRVTAGGASQPTHLATEQELSTDPVARRLAEQSDARGPHRWLAVVPDQPLPYDSTVDVLAPAGTPSAEGPRRTAGDQGFSFQTYGPLRLVDSRCGYKDRCRPDDAIQLQFSNDLDGDAFQRDMVDVQPDIPGAEIYVSGNWLTVTGPKEERTTYTVTVDGQLLDTWGQALGDGVAVKKRTGDREPPEPTLFSPGPDLRVLDPAGRPNFSVYSVALDALRLRVSRVGPDDWADFVEWRQHRGWYRDDVDLPPPPGDALVDRTVPVEGAGATLVQTDIDLGEWLDDKPGHLVVWVEPTRPIDSWRRAAVVAWVQRTDLGVTALADQQQLVAWVTDLADGKPVDSATVQLLPHGKQGDTDADGLARLTLAARPDSPQLLVARKGDDVALLSPTGSSGGSTWRRRDPGASLAWYVVDDRNLYKPGESVKVKGWLRVVDQGVGGDVQALDGAVLGKRAPTSVDWVLFDARRSEISHGTAALTALGGFDLSLDLPDDINLGTASLQLSANAPGVSGTMSVLRFEVQEFRRPEFEVKADPSLGPYVLGDTATATVTAAYYAGGGLPGADVRWTVTPSWASYTPPNQDDWHFGKWVPWWADAWWGFEPEPWLEAPDPLTGTTDATGAHHLDIRLAAAERPQPVNLRAEAVVTDVNRQAWAASTSLLVHPADVYVGLRTARPFYDGGKPVDVDAVVVDIDGHPIAGRPVRLRWWTTRWTRDKKGAWSEVEEQVQTCDRVSTGPTTDEWTTEPVSCRFKPQGGGRFTVRATVTDAAGRANESEITVWVAGDAGDHPRDRSVSQEQVILIPDKDSYQPGDTAKILVQAPFSDANGVWTVQRSGIEQATRFDLHGDTAELSVPITDAHVPNLTVAVDLVGAAPRPDDDGATRGDLPPRPAFAAGQLTLPVPPVTRSLDVAVRPDATGVDPGAHTSLDITVTDADGRPATGAELAVVVVDESVLALTGYRIPDPLDAFYTQRAAGGRSDDLRTWVWLDDPAALGGMGGGGRDDDAEDKVRSFGAMMDGGAMEPTTGAMPPPMMDLAMAEDEAPPEPETAEASGPAIEVRSDFRALALFVPAAEADGDGHFTVPLDLPDSLTRYRVTAVAVQGGQRFGSGEASITARLPVMLRPSAPRFLNFGDRFELPLVVQNQTDDTLGVDLAAGASNARFIDAVDPATPPGASTTGRRQTGRHLEVPPGDRVEVRLPATTVQAGTARFQVAVSARSAGAQEGAESTDAASFDLPVWTPATSEAFATYGEIGGLPPEGAPEGGDPGAIMQPVQAPADVWPQFGGLEITTSSTALSALTDAFLYLQAYPYECAEQRASRVLSVAALRDVLDAFDAEGMPSTDDIEAAMQRDLDELARLQNPDGGWGFWRLGEESWPYVSLHVAHALARAQAKGYAVPDATRSRALDYLRNIEARLPRDYPESARHALSAYALYVRRLLDDADAAKAARLLDKAGIADDKHPDGLSLEALGWLLPTLAEGQRNQAVDQILAHLGNRVSETAAAAQFTTSYGEGDWLLLHSSRRTDAVLLEALIDLRPRNDLVPKLVRGLLDHRVKGRWGNTQENAFVLVALDRYFQVYEADTPDFVARAWLGDQYAGDHAFRGRSTEHVTTRVPMTDVVALAGDAPAPLVLQRDGSGRMYYRVGLRYAPRSLDLQPADRGFVVLRSYEAVDDPADVQRLDDGTWQIAAGARVRVRLKMVADGRRTHVALVDPLPAGLEAINPDLAVSEDIPVDDQQDPALRSGEMPMWWWWWRPWYEHENLRDDRVEAFTTLLGAGVYDYSYVARATTPGVFITPPAKAEEMYHPETFGRSGTDRVVVR